MEFIVFSDSHGAGDCMQAAFDRQICPPDAVFFLGDGLRDLAWCDFAARPIYRVRGNCDLFDTDAEDASLFELGGIRFFAAHGHKYSVKSGSALMASEAARLGADVMLFGHTHLAVCEEISKGETLGGVTLCKPLHIFNPGSIASGSFGVITVRNGRLLLSHGKL